MRGEVRAWLERHAALEPALLDDVTLDRLLAERLRRTGVRDERAYVELLRSSPDEQELLVGRVSVPESWFFRYPRSFELLAEHLATLRSRPDAPATLRLLSAACAMGPEPWAMAMTALHAGWPPGSVRIDAIDRDPAQIAAARTGRSSRQAVRGDVPAWAAGWLSVADDGVRVSAGLQASIEYRRADLLAPNPPCTDATYHVVFCRNLLIYLHASARRTLVSRLAAWLVPDGLLFIGHADPPGLFGEAFVPVRTPHAFALRLVPAGQRGHRRADRPTPRPRPRTGRRPAPDARSVAPPTPPSTTGPRPAPTTAPAPERASLVDARRLADRGRLDEALQATQRVLATEGPGVDALSLLGDVQLALGRLEEARGSFRKAVYLDPEHESSLLQLALISERLDEVEQAAAFRRRADRAHRRQTEAEEGNRGR